MSIPTPRPADEQLDEGWPSMTADARRVRRRIYSWLPGFRSEALRDFATSHDPALIDAVVEDFLTGRPRRHRLAADGLRRLLERPTWQPTRREFEQRERRHAATLRVIRRRGPIQIPVWLRWLESDERADRLVAAVALEALAPSQALAPLSKVLDAELDHDGRLAVSLLRAVAVQPDAHVTAMLEAALERQWAGALDALALRRTPDAIDVLVRTAEQHEQGYDAVSCLLRIADPSILARMCASPKSHLRSQAAQQLGKYDDEGSARQLLALVEDEDPFVRTAAATSLAARGDRRGVPRIIAAILAPTRAWELGELADALATLGDPSALDALRQSIAPRRSPDRPAKPDLDKFVGIDREVMEQLYDPAVYDRLEADGVARVRAAIAKLEAGAK